MTLEPPTVGATVAPVPAWGRPSARRSSRTPTSRSTRSASGQMADRQLLRAVRSGAGDERHQQHVPGAVDPHREASSAPRAQVGIAIYNCTEDKNITWATGVFFDSGGDVEFQKKRIDDNQGARVSGRLTWLPYYDEPSNGRYLMHTGVGVLYTKDQNELAPLCRSPADSRGPAADRQRQLSPAEDVHHRQRRVCDGARAVHRAVRRLLVATSTGSPASNATIGGAYVHASYFLTGENRIFERFGQHGAQFGRNAAVQQRVCGPRRGQPGGLGAQGPLVVPRSRSARCRPIQRLHARLQLVLERPHPPDVRLDPSHDDQRRRCSALTTPTSSAMRWDFNW